MDDFNLTLLKIFKQGLCLENFLLQHQQESKPKSSKISHIIKGNSHIFTSLFVTIVLFSSQCHEMSGGESHWKVRSRAQCLPWSRDGQLNQSPDFEFLCPRCIFMHACMVTLHPCHGRHPHQCHHSRPLDIIIVRIITTFDDGMRSDLSKYLPTPPHCFMLLPLLCDAPITFNCCFLNVSVLVFSFLTVSFSFEPLNVEGVTHQGFDVCPWISF